MSFSKAPRITVMGTNLTTEESKKKKPNKKANLPNWYYTKCNFNTRTNFKGNAISVLENQRQRQTKGNLIF